ncbi:MAG: bacteriohemerythrin [Bacteroidetes bacterium]|nr:bacteriohemerythrin [Bacteroidota bacterium]
MATLDWEQLKMAHLVWRINFRSMLSGGSGKLESIQVKDHTQCEMGKWLHGEGMAKYASNPMFMDLVAYHKGFHEMAAKAYGHYISKETHEANECLAKITDHSNTLMEIIDQFKVIASPSLASPSSPEPADLAIEWKKEYEIGVSQIDEQHKSLVNVINRLWLAIKNRNATHEIAEIIHTLEDYTRVHFAAEEVMLETVGYSDLAGHKKKHAEFIAYLSDYRKQAAAGSKDFMGLYEYLGKWLISHIQKSDRNYMDEINRKKTPVETGFFAKIFKKI